MINRFNKISSIIFPNKKINFFIITILFLGVISGAIFSNIIDLNDQKLIVDKIELLITNINNQDINSLIAFKNSIIITYSYKGIILSILYTLFGQLLNLIVVMILTIYSTMFTLNLIKQIIKSKVTTNIPKKFKNYSLIFLITLIISMISSISEAFLFPTLIKIIIKLFI